MTPASYRVAWRAMREALEQVQHAFSEGALEELAELKRHVDEALEMADEAERDRDQKGSPQA